MLEWRTRVGQEVGREPDSWSEGVRTTTVVVVAVADKHDEITLWQHSLVSRLHQLHKGTPRKHTGANGVSWHLNGIPSQLIGFYI